MFITSFHEVPIYVALKNSLNKKETNILVYLLVSSFKSHSNVIKVLYGSSGMTLYLIRFFNPSKNSFP